MVAHTGTTLRADAYRAVNLPEPVEVEEDTNGTPLSVKIPGKQMIVSIEDSWRIDDEWWRREPVSRLYLEVLIGNGRRLVLYKDLVTGDWYRQDY